MQQTTPEKNSKSPDAFLLIQKLTPNEKRYFSLMSDMDYSKSGQQKKSIELFRILNKMNKYDRNLALKQFSSGKNLNQWLSILYSSILKHLRAFHSKKSQESQIISILEDINILEQKGLYQQQLRLLNRGLKLAKEISHTPLLQILLKKKVTFIIGNEKTKLSDKIHTSLSELESQVIASTSEIKIFSVLYKTFLQWRLGNYQNKINDELKSLELQLRSLKELSSSTPLAKLYSLYCAGIQGVLKRDLTTAAKKYEEVLSFFEKNATFSLEYPGMHIISISNYMQILSKQRSYKKFPILLRTLESIPTIHFDHEAEKYQNLASLKLLYFGNTGKYSDAIACIPEISNWLKIYKEKINHARLLTIKYTIFCIYFMANKFSESLDWVFQIQLEGSKDPRKDLIQLSIVLAVMSHYELENEDHIDSYLRKISYNMRKISEAVAPIAKAVRKNIRALINLPPSDTKKKKEILENFKIEILDNTPKNAIGRDETIHWISWQLEKLNHKKT